MEETLKQILDRLTGIENKLVNLEENQNKILEKLDNLEAINANRHIEISNEIKELSQDISSIESITAKNWRDISNMKKAK